MTLPDTPNEGSPEPEAWCPSDRLACIKYAREQGFITALEAQREVRKLLHLKP